jgi:hypothetical protein
VADFNQFGSVKPSQGGDPQHCARCEAMLLDALDGTLSPADQAAFDLHLLGCSNCTAMLADARRGAAWMEMLKSPRPEPPAALMERILAQTSGAQTTSIQAASAAPAIVLGSNDRLRTPGSLPVRPGLPGRPTLVPSSAAQPAFASTNVIPFRTRITHGFRSIGHTMLQPRLAMTAAMAFFSIALTMNLTGVRITNLRASDLKPSSLRRSASEAMAGVIRYSDNLRVVYELESRVRDLQRASDDDRSGSGTTTPAPQNGNQNGSQQPDDQNRTPDQRPDQKPGNKKQDQKQTRPNPGSSRRETPTGSIQLAESVRPQAPSSSFARKGFVVFTPSVFKQEGELV